MRKTKYKILFALMGFGLFSFTSCMKKESVQLSVNPGIRELSGVPAFADTLLRNSNFNIETQKFGVLHFELEHQKMSTFNGKRNLFMGKVSSAKTGATGTAYLFSGTGGVQIGLTLYSSMNHESHRLQIRSFNGMHDKIRLMNADGSYTIQNINSVSITEEMRDKGILPEFKDSIVLESGSQYELIDLNAFEECWLKSNPLNQRKACGEEHTDESVDTKRMASAAVRVPNMHFAFHVVNGNPFGLYTYNRTVDDYTSIYGVIHGIDYNNLIPISATLTSFNQSGLAWNSNHSQFLVDWMMFYLTRLRTSDAAESVRVNYLCTGNGWSNAVGNTFHNALGTTLNQGLISTAPGISPFTASHEASHALGAVHDATVRYPYCWWWYQDLMRDSQANAVYCVNWHANGDNINAIRSRMQGY